MVRLGLLGALVVWLMWAFRGDPIMTGLVCSLGGGTFLLAYAHARDTVSPSSQNATQERR